MWRLTVGDPADDNVEFFETRQEALAELYVYARDYATDGAPPEYVAMVGTFDRDDLIENSGLQYELVEVDRTEVSRS